MNVFNNTFYCIIVANTLLIDIMKLVIMRHGQAESFRKPDETRALTSDGNTQAFTAGKWLAENEKVSLPIDLALVSPYVRAEQTYEQFNQQVHISQKVICEDIVPDGNPSHTHDYIRALIEETPSLECILVVSHMPFVSYFLEDVLLDKKSMLFDTSSMAIVNYDPILGGGYLETVYHPS